MARKDKDKPNLTASSEPKNNIIRINEYRTDEDAPDLYNEMTDQPENELNVPDYLVAGAQGDDSCRGQRASGTLGSVLSTDMSCEEKDGFQRFPSVFDQTTVMAPGGDLDAICTEMASDRGVREMTGPKIADAGTGQSSDPLHFIEGADDVPKAAPRYDNQTVFAPGGDLNSLEPQTTTGGSDKGPAGKFIDSDPERPSILASGNETDPFHQKNEGAANSPLPDPRNPVISEELPPGYRSTSEEISKATDEKTGVDQDNQETIFDIDAETAASPKGCPDAELFDEETLTLAPPYARCPSESVPGSGDKSEEGRGATDGSANTNQESQETIFDPAPETAVSHKGSLAPGEEFSDENIRPLPPSYALPEKRQDKTSEDEMSFLDPGTQNIVSVPDDEATEEFDIARDGGTSGGDSLSADDSEDAPAINLGTDAIVPSAADEYVPPDETLLLTPEKEADGSHAPDTDAVDLDASTIMASQEIPPPTAPALSEKDAEKTDDLPVQSDEDRPVFELGAEAVIEAQADEDGSVFELGAEAVFDASADEADTDIPPEETLLLTPEKEAVGSHAPETDAVDLDASTIMASQEITPDLSETDSESAEDLPVQSDEEEPVFELGAEAIVPVPADEDESVFELGAEAVFDAPADESDTDIPPEETLLLTPEKEAVGSHAPETDAVDLDASTIMASQEITPDLSETDAERAENLPDQSDEDEPVFELGAEAVIEAPADEDESVFELRTEAVIGAPADEDESVFELRTEAVIGAPADETDTASEETLLLTPEKEAVGSHAPETDAVDLDASTIMASQEITPDLSETDAERAENLPDQSDEDEPVFELGAEAVIEAPADEDGSVLELGTEAIVPAPTVTDSGPTDARHDTIDLADTIFQEQDGFQEPEGTEAPDPGAVAEPVGEEAIRSQDTDEDIASPEKIIIEPDAKTIFSPVCIIREPSAAAPEERSHPSEAPAAEESTSCELCEPDDARTVFAPIGTTGDKDLEQPDTTDVPDAIYAAEASHDVYEPDMLTKSEPDPEADLADVEILSDAEIFEESRDDDVSEKGAGGWADTPDTYDDEGLTSFDLLKSLDDLPAYEDEYDYSDTDASVGFLDVLQAVAQKDDRDGGALAGMLDVGMISKISPEAFEDVEERMPKEEKAEMPPPAKPPAEAPPADTMAADETGLPESEHKAGTVSAETSETDLRKAEIVKKVPPAEGAEKYYLPISPDEAAAVLENAVEKVFSERIELIVRQVTEQAIIEGLKKNNPFSLNYYHDDEPM